MRDARIILLILIMVIVATTALASLVGLIDHGMNQNDFNSFDRVKSATATVEIDMHRFT